MAERDSAKRALIVWGGWDGHEPRQVATVFADALIQHGFHVEIADTLDVLADEANLQALSLLVPVWTMGTITSAQLQPVLRAVEGGMGLAGCHGGMCDAFRDAPEWQWMTGGQWVAHPGNDGVEYVVRLTDTDHFITQGAPREFWVRSEQYYLHTDPSNVTLAVTPFPVAPGPHTPNGPFDMPVIWTRLWGQGRVAYNSLGHTAAVVAEPPVLSLMTRAMLWAARADLAA